jgi:hypothetical protein
MAEDQPGGADLAGAGLKAFMVAGSVRAWGTEDS